MLIPITDFVKSDLIFVNSDTPPLHYNLVQAKASFKKRQERKKEKGRKKEKKDLFSLHSQSVSQSGVSQTQSCQSVEPVRVLSAGMRMMASLNQLSSVDNKMNDPLVNGDLCNDQSLPILADE